MKRMRFLRYAARTVLIVIALFWFSFAGLSGAGNGVGGFLVNLQNALLWLGLLAIVYIAFRCELLGGAIGLVAGIGSVFFFNAWTSPVVLLGVSLPISVAGIALMVCNRLDPPGHST